MNNEEKAKDFMNYIAKNEKELKYILAKNITYDKDIFDDVFNDTIIKVYNSILKNGTEVSDYKNYFYISLKWQYILQFNRNKSYTCKTVRDYFDNNDIIEEVEEKENKFNAVIETLDIIKNDIIKQYGEWYATVFFEYYTDKANKGCSYKKLATKLGTSIKQIQEVIKTIKEYIRTSEKMNNLKEILHTEDAVYK